jgi:hypothetical protein
MNNSLSFFKKRYAKLSLFLFIFLGILASSSYTLYAQVMQSSTYQIASDSLNGGGKDSSSTSYSLGDTVGELGTGDSSGILYQMHAGFWQMQESFISLSAPADIVLGNIGGILGDGSEDTAIWTVTTDNPAGYSMTINASTNPALSSIVGSFADYTPGGANPDFLFTNAATDSSFGFSPEGTEVVSRFKDDGISSCNTGASETSGRCWDGLSTTPQQIAESTTSNHPAGSDVTVRFRAESGSSHIQPAGVYSATITITAVTL